MNANELRIGNWIEYYDSNKETEGIHKICLTEEYLCIILKEEYTSDFEEIYPIPLTEEWLIKFGMDNVNYIDNLGYLIETNEGWYLDDCEGGYVNDKPIKFVHTFQNFYFAITGEELNITT